MTTDKNHIIVDLALYDYRCEAEDEVNEEYYENESGINYSQKS